METRSPPVRPSAQTEKHVLEHRQRALQSGITKTIRPRMQRATSGCLLHLRKWMDFFVLLTSSRTGGRYLWRGSSRRACRPPRPGSAAATRRRNLRHRSLQTACRSTCRSASAAGSEGRETPLVILLRDCIPTFLDNEQKIVVKQRELEPLARFEKAAEEEGS